MSTTTSTDVHERWPNLGRFATGSSSTAQTSGWARVEMDTAMHRFADEVHQPGSSRGEVDR